MTDDSESTSAKVLLALRQLRRIVEGFLFECRSYNYPFCELTSLYASIDSFDAKVAPADYARLPLTFREAKRELTKLYRILEAEDYCDNDNVTGEHHDISHKNITALHESLCNYINSESLSPTDGVAAESFISYSEGGDTHGSIDVPDKAVTDRWMKLIDAERMSLINRGTICRAADKGEIIDNQEKGSERRIDRVSFTIWATERAKKPEPQESAEAVERKLREAKGR